MNCVSVRHERSRAEQIIKWLVKVNDLATCRGIHQAQVATGWPGEGICSLYNCFRKPTAADGSGWLCH